jgi:hypothetical protein
LKKIVLIGCVSKKLAHAASAQDLYISSLFRLNLQFARTRQPDATYILSAKHGLLDLNTEIEPYDLTLNNMATRQVQSWAEQVLEKLKERADLSNPMGRTCAQRDHAVPAARRVPAHRSRGVAP